MVGRELCICQCIYPSFLVPCTLVPINSGLTADPYRIRLFTVSTAEQVHDYDVATTLPRAIAPRAGVDTVAILVVVVDKCAIDRVPVPRSFPCTAVVTGRDASHPVIQNFNFLTVEPGGEEARPIHPVLAVVDLVADFSPGSRSWFRSSSCIEHRPKRTCVPRSTQ